MRKAVLQIGATRATLDSGTSYFTCDPVNPSLELALNDHLRSIRGYWPDRLVYYAESAAKQFGAEILQLDRQPTVGTSDPTILY